MPGTIAIFPWGDVIEDYLAPIGLTATEVADTLAQITDRVSVPVIVDADTGKLADPPDFLVRGFEHDPRAFDPAVTVIEKTLSRAASEGIGDSRRLEQMIGRDVGRWAQRAFRRPPMIIPVVVEV